MEAVATAEMDEPQVFTKTKLEIVQRNTTRYPYLTFKLGPGGLQRLVVRIWSHDQGWCDQHLETQDPFADSHTWFSLGLFNEKAPENEAPPDLYNFQRNMRASNDMRCYTHGWNIGVPVQDESSSNETHGWLESLAEAEGLTIGLFPLAQYAGWENWVWKMEVRVYPRTRQEGPLHEPRPSTNNGPLHDTIALWPDRPHFATVRLVDPEEKSSIVRGVNQDISEDHQGWAGYLGSLSIRATARYIRTGAMEDLEKATETAQQAVIATPQDHPNRAGRLNNLGTLLGDRYRRTGAMADLEKATETAQEAVDTIPQDHPDRARHLNSLGVQLWNRYRRTGAMADLEKAIKTAQEAVDATPQDHPSRAGRLNNLGNLLGDRYGRTEAMADLEKAIETAQQAVDTTPQDHPSRAAVITNLGGQLGNRYSRTGAMEDLENSYSSFLSAFHQSTSPISARIRAARRLLSSPFALRDQEHSLQYASEAIELLAQLTPRALQHTDKQHLLLQAAGLASDAAALALLDREPATAVSWLEAGRGVLASALQDIRIDLSNLHRDYPTLANTFDNSRSILDAPTRSDIDVSQEATGTSIRNNVDLRRQAQARLDEAIREIRQKPGYERFLLPPTEKELLAAATHGPIVLVNVSRHRCDALIVQSIGIQHCELPSLSYQDIQQRRRTVSSSSPAMLKWLWNAIVEPVLSTLHPTQVRSDRPWPRVWWIPTGPLVGFPLHAAGFHTERDGRTTLDRVASSYATSVRSLVPLRQQRPLETARGLVLVDMQDTPGQSPLHYAGQEIYQVEVATRSLCLIATHPKKKKQAVQEALSGCQIFHFAGHGGTDARHPLRSRLLLSDWKEDPLTVESLLDMDLQRHAPFLAYLSACGSGEVRDERSVDESLHLSSACQLAGFRHVIGTLWSVDDELCVEMAKLTYEFLAEQGLSDEAVSQGLHIASRRLRDEWLCRVQETTGIQGEGGDGLRFHRKGELVDAVETVAPLWVPYVHYGA